MKTKTKPNLKTRRENENENDRGHVPRVYMGSQDTTLTTDKLFFFWSSHFVFLWCWCTAQVFHERPGERACSTHGDRRLDGRCDSSFNPLLEGGGMTDMAG